MDRADTETGAGTPEAVAFRLMREVLAHEVYPQLTREVILDTYAECLRTVQGDRRGRRHRRK